MSVFALKTIALAAMLIDHMGAAIPEFFGFPLTGLNIFRVIGRVAFPIFVYLIAEGFRHTNSPARYLARLGIFALLSEIPFDLAFNARIDFLDDTSVFYTLFFGGAAIAIYQKFRESNPVAAFFPVLIFMPLAEILTADYGSYGVLFIFLMYIINPLKPRLLFMAALCVWQHNFIFEYIWYGQFERITTLHWLLFPATLIPVALVAFYNGKRGTNAKWFFYAAYPVHLLMLAVI